MMRGAITMALLTMLTFPATADFPRPYLALMTFQSADLASLTDAQLDLLEASPYDGMATWVARYDALEPMPDVSMLEPRVAYLRAHTTKHLWPTVFLSRMVGQVEGGPRHEDAAVNAEFAQIRGLDLDNEQGALDTFLLNWRRCLQLARRLGAPGICLDPEFYNDYNMEGLAVLAKRRGEPEGVTLEKVHAVGARMADIIAEEYPQAVVWCLFTRLCGARSHDVDGVPGHILTGCLDRANEKQIPLTLIEGGEDSIGYTNASLDALAAKLDDQENRYAPLRERYPQLVLGATIAPWLDKDHRAYWMKDAAAVDTIEQFEPWFTQLMERVDFLWIYGAGNAYNVWDKPYSERFPPVLAAAKAAATAKRGATD